MYPLLFFILGTMVENVARKYINSIRWKQKLLRKYAKIGMTDSIFKQAVSEIVSKGSRKNSYKSYMGMARQFYLNEYGILFSERMNPLNAEEVLLDGIYSNFSEFIPGKNDVVVDIGAQFGDYTLLCSKFYGARHVHAFEPFPENYSILVENIELNEVKNVSHYNLAVGSTDSHVEMGYDGNAATAFSGEGIFSARTVPIDSLDLGKPRLIKIDVEGFELEVLRGAMKTISDNMPNLIMEVHSRDLRKGVVSLLKPLGYKVVQKDRPKISPGEEISFAQNIFLSPVM